MAKKNISKPEATKISTALEFYKSRKLYHSQHSIERPGMMPADFWNKNPLYGRIDHKAYPVYLSETHLSQIDSDDFHMALNFVVDAYHDMYSYVYKAGFAQHIAAKKTQLANLRVMRSWVPIHEGYHDLMKAHYNAFYTEFTKIPSINKKIVSVDTFLEQFMNYSYAMINTLPITRAGYILSRNNNPAISGLILEIKNSNHNDDRKRLEILNDPNFNFFLLTANKFGFMVDANAPWRLVADIGSRAMKKYMVKHGTNYYTIFDDFYIRAYENDVEVFKEYVKSFYNSYIAAEPSIKDNKICITNGQIKTKTTTKIRSFLSASKFNKIPNNFWLKNYAMLRSKEANTGWNDVVLQKEVIACLAVLQKRNIKDATKYFEDRIGGLDPLSFPQNR